MLRKCKDWYGGHREILWALYFIPYVIGFFSLEALNRDCYVIRCPLDDAIPFCEWFVFLYVSWFAALIILLIYFVGHDKDSFVDLCALMFTGMTLCLLIYLVWPNAIDLRVPLTNDNPASLLLAALHSADTPTNVCPSIHCSSSAAMAVAAFKSRLFRDKPAVRWAIGVWMALICVSTLFTKQHSVVDVVCGLALTAALTPLVYRTGWKKALAKTRLGFLV